MTPSRPKSRLAPAMIVAGVPLVAVYLLSIGPSYKLATVDRMDAAAFNAIYLPILAPCNRWEPLGQALLWYLEFWEPTDPYADPFRLKRKPLIRNESR